MPEFGICRGDAPKQTFTAEDRKCDLCGHKVDLEEGKNKEKKGLVFSGLVHVHLSYHNCGSQMLIFFNVIGEIVMIDR